MNNSKDNTPEDSREVLRRFYARTQFLPTLAKNQLVWVLVMDEWTTATIDRRLPGNVYWVYLTGVPKKRGHIIVNCVAFGGVVQS